MALLLFGLLLVGCPRSTGRPTATAVSSNTWVVFSMVERGTAEPLQGFVWAEGHQDDFEYVDGRTSLGVRFEGLGKVEDGYVIPFTRRQQLRLLAWSPGHEMASVVVDLGPGENAVFFELSKVEVEDDRVPESIQLEVPQHLPTESPRTGT